jgi:hypothetical protein
MGKHDSEATRPGNDEIGDKYVPPFVGIVEMEESVHGYELVCED